MVLRVMRDSRWDIAAWVDRAVWEFNPKEVRTPRGSKILVATYEVSFQKMLAEMSKFRPPLVILNASFERALYPGLDTETTYSLNQTALVLATMETRRGRAIATPNTSIKVLLRNARVGSIRLLQPDPAESSVGLGVLILEGYAEGAITQDGAKTDSVLRDRLLQGLSESVILSDLAGSDILNGQWDVGLITEARCADLRRRGVSVRAVYPQEGTLRFDYPAFIPKWVSGDEREAAKLFLDFLNSREMQALKQHYGLDESCVDDKPPPKVVNPPSPTVTSELLDAWVRKRQTKLSIYQLLRDNLPRGRELKAVTTQPTSSVSGARQR